jgi:glucose-1-phosphate adenylyltransferase
MPRVLGFLNLHHAPDLGPLTQHRSIASTTFLGRYAFMDFMLSNFSNSGIDQVAILVKRHPRSILKHLGSRNTWNVNTKNGFEVIAYNERSHRYGSRYNTDIANIVENKWILKQARADYVVIAPTHFIAPIDFRPIINEHIRNNANITMVYKKVNTAKDHFIGADVLTINKDELVTHITQNRGTHARANVSMETLVITFSYFKEILKEARNASAYFSLYDFISHKIDQGEQVHTYEYTGYLRCFDNFEHYFEYSFELLDYEIRKNLFLEDWPIYTVTHDSPPAKYDESAVVRNSFIANGSKIGGTVRNSILSRFVHIEKGAKVDHCIIFTDSEVKANRKLQYCVIDKSVVVEQAKEIKGTKDDIAYVKEGDHV